MNNADILKFISESEDKDFLLKVRTTVATKIANFKYGIGDSVDITFEYMIGDADGDTQESMCYGIDDENALNALTIMCDILDNHTDPNEGTWGFCMDRENFSEKPAQVYHVLYGADDEDEDSESITEYTTTDGTVITLNPEIIAYIGEMVDELFTSETGYSFLIFEGYEIEVR